MGQFSRTWWGQRFIEALEQFTDPARLGRGRSYASGGRILEYTLAKGTVTARVRGSINPYFGVYKEPIYKTTITIKAIYATDWAKVIHQIASRADLVTKLLMNEMPDTIEDAFSGLGPHLLPHSERDFETSCSCPDWTDRVDTLEKSGPTAHRVRGSSRADGSRDRLSQGIGRCRRTPGRARSRRSRRAPTRRW